MHSDVLNKRSFRTVFSSRNVPESVCPRCVAEICTSLFIVTGRTVTSNVTSDFPASTVTNAGTVTAASEDDNATAIPPTGALPVRRTVPCTCSPPAKDDGDN